MKTQTLIIGLVVIIAAIAIFFALGGTHMFSSTMATSTVATSTDITGSSSDGSTPGAPSAATNATVAPTDTTIVVTGTVNPNGAATNYWYEFGTTPSLGKSTSIQSVGSGYSAIKTPAYITGLTKGTTYYYRLVAQNSYGKSTGEQQSVTTTIGTPAPTGSAPTAKTLDVSGQSATGAVLTGSVNPNKSSTQYWFEYGTSASLGSITNFIFANNGSTAVSASAPLSGLSAGTTYYYRLNAQNEFGTSNGAILSFKTSAAPSSKTSLPVVTTQLPSAIATTTVTLNGTVNPSGSETKYWFEYSTDTLLGSVLLKTTSQRSAGAGQSTITAQANVTNLTSNTTYYVRLVAQNANGIVRGDKQSFTTK